MVIVPVTVLDPVAELKACVLNAVIADSMPVGQSVLQGEGAGPGPTTSSLISDLCSVLRGNIKFPFVISNAKRKLASFASIDNKFFSVYLRLDVKDKHGILSDIAKVMASNKVSIKRLIKILLKIKRMHRSLSLRIMLKALL